MTTRYIVLGCLSWIVACSPDNSPQSTDAAPPGPETREAKRLPKPPPYYVVRADSSCQAELRQARLDAQRDRLTYVLINSGKVRYNEELQALLKKSGIKFIYIPENCTGDYECYGYYMDSVIVRKYGRGFTDRLKRDADSIFVSAWPHKTYWAWDVDQAPSCAVDDLHAYVTKRLKRPAGWDASPKAGPYFASEREFITAKFVVDTTGTLTEIVLPADPSNLKSTNRKHLPYLRREISRLLRTTGQWQPGKLNGHKVKCQYFADVTLNPEQY